MKRLLIVLALLCVTIPVANAAPLNIATVKAPDINCVFDSDCTITVSDTTDTITLPGGSGSGFLQSRTLPVGEPGTPAAGLYRYKYRIDLRQVAGILDIPCITSFQLDVGPIVPLDYDNDGITEDVFVVTQGGLGTVAPSSVNQSGNTITFAFSPAVCAGSYSGGGDSSFFFGLTSQYPPRDITATIQNSPDGGTINLAARAPAYPLYLQKPEVWHAWPESIRSILEQHAAEYQLELVDFASEAELAEALRDPSANPDLILGPDAWSDTLIEAGLASAYCLPDGCEECFGANPPRWCLYANGGFSYSRNIDFQFAGLCESEQCPPCLSNKPPDWCQFARLNRAQAPDIFQAGFARFVEDQVLPVGTPIWWEADLVLANPAWFLERELAMPGSLDEIIDLQQEYPDLVYIDPAFDPTPTPMRNFVDALKGDPSPQPSKTGILVAEAEQFRTLTEEVGPLFLFSLADYHMQPIVQGVYVNPHSEHRDQALAVADLLASPNMQVELFDAAGSMPAHGEAWINVADEALVDLSQQLLPGVLGILPGINIRDFIERPPFTPPDFGNDACGLAAAELYTRLIDFVGADDVDRIRAEFSSQQFARICRAHLSRLDFGDDDCAARAESTFAMSLMEWRGTTGAVYRAEAAARAELAACRG
ncbi:MAG: hypothetical protein AAGF95_32465 [Chloroflexota bacterium]